uniref:Histone acetyltransferase HAC1 isoform X2 n=1 Tax=Rhizophora mucronata TaxID=61149 RepID=A0A2P2MUK7_RHIMU
MVNKCTESLSSHCFNLRSKILNRIKIRQIHATLIWKLTV